MADTEAAGDAKAARGRGRPKKATPGGDKAPAPVSAANAGGDDSPKNENSVEDGEKRGRGRPRKAAEAATNAMKDQAASGTKREHEGDEGEPTSKRGRGRPKGTGGKKKRGKGGSPKKGGRAKGAGKKKKEESESEGGAGDSGGESGGD